MSIFVPDFVNVHTPTESYVWLRLKYGGEDLVPVEAHRFSIGEMPEDREEEIAQSGWEDLILDHGNNEESGEGWTFTTNGIMFALKNGIAPWQPFLVRVDSPIYSQSWTDCGMEYDCEVPWDLERILPWNMTKVTKRWERFTAQLRQDREQAVGIMREFNQKRVTDISSMYLYSMFYWANRYTSMDPPNGVAVRLCSKHTELRIPGMYKGAGSDLSEGRDDGGNRELAMQRLLERVTALWPHITPEIVRSLPHRWS